MPPGRAQLCQAHVTWSAQGARAAAPPDYRVQLIYNGRETKLWSLAHMISFAGTKFCISRAKHFPALYGNAKDGGGLGVGAGLAGMEKQNDAACGECGQALIADLAVVPWQISRSGCRPTFRSICQKHAPPSSEGDTEVGQGSRGRAGGSSNGHARLEGEPTSADEQRARLRCASVSRQTRCSAATPDSRGLGLA